MRCKTSPCLKYERGPLRAPHCSRNQGEGRRRSGGAQGWRSGGRGGRGGARRGEAVEAAPRTRQPDQFITTQDPTRPPLAGLALSEWTGHPWWTLSHRDCGRVKGLCPVAPSRRTVRHLASFGPPRFWPTGKASLILLAIPAEGNWELQKRRRRFKIECTLEVNLFPQSIICGPGVGRGVWPGWWQWTGHPGEKGGRKLFPRAAPRPEGDRFTRARGGTCRPRLHRLRLWGLPQGQLAPWNPQT